MENTAAVPGSSQRRHEGGQVIGSSIKTKFEVVNGKPDLVRLPEINFIDTVRANLLASTSTSARRPIATFGNSDGDLQMLEWTAAGKGPRLTLLVHHTDGIRQYAYDRKSSFVKLDKALDEATGKGGP